MKMGGGSSEVIYQDAPWMEYTAEETIILSFKVEGMDISLQRTPENDQEGKYAWDYGGYTFFTDIEWSDEPVDLELFQGRDAIPVTSASFSKSLGIIKVGHKNEDSIIVMTGTEGIRLLKSPPITLNGEEYCSIIVVTDNSGIEGGWIALDSNFKYSGTYEIKCYRYYDITYCPKELVEIYNKYGVEWSWSYIINTDDTLTFTQHRNVSASSVYTKDTSLSEKLKYPVYVDKETGHFIIPFSTELNITYENESILEGTLRDGFNPETEDISSRDYYIISTTISLKDPEFSDLPYQEVELQENGKLMTGGYIDGKGANIINIKIHGDTDVNFSGNNTIKDVEIKGTREISKFDHCAKLESVRGDKTIVIGEYVFWGCSNLTTVSFPECTSIGDRAFEDCPNLTMVFFPNVTNIGNTAFFGCKIPRSQFNVGSLTSSNNWGAKLYDDVRGVWMDGTKAIGANKNISMASIDYCTSIGSTAFQYCFNLTTASFPECTSIGWGAFSNCTSLTTVYFPECTYVDSYAFLNCRNLTMVSFPKVTNIGNQVFYYCSKLSEVYFTGNKIPLLTYSNVFQDSPIGNLDSTAAIYVSPSMVESFKTAENWSYFSSIIKPYNG